MEFLNPVKEAASALKQLFVTSWWIEITTTKPHCTYYFGPFQSGSEAESAQPGFIEDLQAEGAQGIQATLKRCRNPEETTICHEEHWSE